MWQAKKPKRSKKWRPRTESRRQKSFHKTGSFFGATNSVQAMFLHYRALPHIAGRGWILGKGPHPAPCTLPRGGALHHLFCFDCCELPARCRDGRAIYACVFYGCPQLQVVSTNTLHYGLGQPWEALSRRSLFEISHVEWVNFWKRDVRYMPPRACTPASTKKLLSNTPECKSA